MSSLADVALPSSWAEATLGHLVEILDSRRKPINAKERASRLGEIPYYGATGQVGWIDDFLFDEELVLLGEDGAPFLDPSKPVAYMIRGKSWVNNHAHVLRALGLCPNAFLMHQLNQLDYRPFVSGTTRLKLPQGPMKQIPLKVPPLPEQHRIVAAIESYLTRLDDAVASLERVQKNLKRYRASVLKAAVEGRLVPTEAELARKEGREFEPASVLLERILKERRRRWEKEELAKMKAKGKEPKNDKWKDKYKEPVAPDTSDLPGLPEGWVWAQMDVVGRVQLGRQRSPKNHEGPHMRPYLRVANVYEDRLDLTDVMEMNFDPADYDRYRLEDGDILLNEGQSLELVGRPAMYRGQIPGACFQNTLVRFQAHRGLEREYALLVFRAFLHNGAFQRIAQWTTNIAHLGAGRFAQMAFPLPPVAEQQRIAVETDRILTLAGASDNAAKSACNRCQRLRQSILKWAFEGKLVDQDLNDEPASLLLERIKAERARLEAQKKTTSKARRASSKKSSRRKM